MHTNEPGFTQDPRLLLALSLSIGKSLDPHTVAQDFLNALAEAPTCIQAALWWPDPEHADALGLLASAAGRRSASVRHPATHPLSRTAHAGTVRLLSSADPLFTDLLELAGLNQRRVSSATASTHGNEIEPSRNAGALFPLDNQGVLALFSTTSTALAPFQQTAFTDLCQRLAIAIQGAVAHTRNKQMQRAPTVEAVPPVATDAPPATANVPPVFPDGYLHTLLRAAPDLVWLKDAEGKYMACSKRYERFIGAAEGSIRGKSDHDFFSDEIADTFDAKDQAILASGQASTYEEWDTCATDGHTEYLEITKTPLYSPDGRPLGIFGVGHDVTERKQTEETSRQLASMLRLMCDNVPDMIWAKDLDKHYIFANKALCVDLLNANEIREPIGKSDLFFSDRERRQHPDDPQWHTFGELCQESDEIILQTKKPFVFVEYGHIKGKPLCLEIHKSPFVNASGTIIGTVGCARDITGRRRIEDELEQYRHHLEEVVEQRTSALLETETRASSILESSADGLYGVDPEGCITFINPAACQMLGYQEQEAIGARAHELFNHHHADGSLNLIETCPAHQALCRGEALRCSDEVYWHADGHPIPVMFALHPTTQNGANSGAVVSFVDITEQRAAEEARERALIAAENLARTRSQFLANMSHEIRTPLNGILGFAQIGLRTFSDAAKAGNAFEKILASGNQLLGIVNDVLDFSKIEAGKLSIAQEPVLLFELIDHAVDVVAERAHAKKLELRVEKAKTLPTVCLSDPLRIEQILLNLLSNAIKFTEQGEIQLSAGRIGRWLVVRVTDTGIGIAAGELKQIFNPFHQSDGSSTRRFGGTGLGLAITKHILELMGGDMEVTSEPGLGSQFEFRIPYVEATQEPMRPITADALPFSRKLVSISILVVDDDHTSALVLKHSLEEDGATVTVATNGLEAIALIQTQGWADLDLILMDIQMPMMDGYEATRRIKKLAPDLPIIGQSAHVFGEDKANCLAAGMDAYIAKPIGFRRLTELILKHVPGKTPAI